MKPEAVPASKSGSSSTVAFSWEHEPGVSKESHSEARKPAAGAPRAETAVSRRTPARAKKPEQVQAPVAAAAAVTAHPHRHRLRVPPPPGGPGAPDALPPGRRKASTSRRVRPADDPFLAAYLACTEDGGRGYKGAQKMLGWAGIGPGLGFGIRGLGLSCQSSCEVVEDCVVRLAKIPGTGED